jgi:hypothetical protein
VAVYLRPMSCIFCRTSPRDLAEVVDRTPHARVPRRHAAGRRPHDGRPDRARRAHRGHAPAAADSLFRTVQRLAGPVRKAVNAAGTPPDQHWRRQRPRIRHVHVHSSALARRRRQRAHHLRRRPPDQGRRRRSARLGQEPGPPPPTVEELAASVASTRARARRRRRWRSRSRIRRGR